MAYNIAERFVSINGEGRKRDSRLSLYALGDVTFAALTATRYGQILTIGPRSQCPRRIYWSILYPPV